MKYNKTLFIISCEDVLLQSVRELLMDACAEIGYESFEEEDKKVYAYIQTSLYDKAKVDEMLHHFPIPNISITYETEELEEQNWNEEWEKQGFETININNKVFIYDARNNADEAEKLTQENTINIGIEAKQAFGTGTHETTRMVIASLLNLSLQGKRVLDCGCGTGILGITASKLGASDVIGYDIDEWSVTNSEHNAQLNKVTNMEVLHGDSNILSHVCGFFDVVIANINRNILLADIPHFVNVMAETSTLILSGFYTEDISLLVEKAKEYGFHEYAHQEENNWACVSFTRKA